MGYGQHQSFYLRINWLLKAIKAINAPEQNRFLYREDAAEKIGLGKNMVQSLRHWVVATEIVEPNNRAVLSQFGEIMSDFDPYMELKDTASIIHFHLINDREPCTSWYWYFNVFNKKSATKEQIVNDLLKWIDNQNERKPSAETIKRDVDCLVRLYCDKNRADDPEEVIQSPLCNMGLVLEEKTVISKRNLKYNNVGLAALMYVLLIYQERSGETAVSIDELLNKEFLWGKVFNLPRNEIIKALDSLTIHPYFPIQFDRTNRLDIIHLPNVLAIDFLFEEYRRVRRELV